MSGDTPGIEADTIEVVLIGGPYPGKRFSIPEETPWLLMPPPDSYDRPQILPGCTLYRRNGRAQDDGAWEYEISR